MEILHEVSVDRRDSRLIREKTHHGGKYFLCVSDDEVSVGHVDDVDWAALILEQHESLDHRRIQMLGVRRDGCPVPEPKALGT